MNRDRVFLLYGGAFLVAGAILLVVMAVIAFARGSFAGLFPLALAPIVAYVGALVFLDGAKGAK